MVPKNTLLADYQIVDRTVLPRTDHPGFVTSHVMLLPFGVITKSKFVAPAPEPNVIVPVQSRLTLNVTGVGGDVDVEPFKLIVIVPKPLPIPS